MCASLRVATFVGLLLLQLCDAWITPQSYQRSNVCAFSCLEENSQATARSVFGTKEYWDDTYEGRGDFPAEEYTWYYGWEVIGKYMKEHVGKDRHVLIPGIGNDPILLDLLAAGYRDITAQDYSEYAIERQQDLLSYAGDTRAIKELVQSDVRQLPNEWTDRFDAILEKGLLDAVYLSGDGNVEQAVESLSRTLRQGGIFMSISGVVPEDLRRDLFDKSQWTWLRDGSDDLQAGCFILQKK